MFKKKCPSCEEKIEKKFSYCPHCGASLVESQDGDDFGMLGQNDSTEKTQEEIKLPFGMEKIMNSLIKQLDKQMGTMNLENGKGIPKGIQIRIARGAPQMGQVSGEVHKKKMPIIPEKEVERRANLPKVEVESKVRRIADTIIYEIEAPNVRKSSDVVLTKLATGLEIKAYSENKCYIKFIPLKVEVIRYYVDRDKVFIELKG